MNRSVFTESKVSLFSWIYNSLVTYPALPAGFFSLSSREISVYSHRKIGIYLSS